MTTISNILFALDSTTKRTEKESILKENDSPLFRKLLEYTYNPYKQYYVVKVPAVVLGRPIPDHQQWENFFVLLDRLDRREITGNSAVMAVYDLFVVCSEENVSWMRKSLDRHMNVGITPKTINKVYKNLIPTFDVQLAHKFEEKRIKGQSLVAAEPKLDGLRCIAIAKNKDIILYSRNGKNITNNYENTIVSNINGMLQSGRVPDNIVFDGELMGTDFTQTVSQFRRKTDADVSSHYYHVFDWMSLDDWIKKSPTMNSQEMREVLEDMALETHGDYLRTVPRDIIHPDQIKSAHDSYVSQGYEGAMIKILDEGYKFGRGYNIMKYKSFYDVDLKVIGFEQGVGKYRNVLGSIIVDYNGVKVNVGSGFSDESRELIWNNRSQFRGQIAEVRYFEETPDGSLRFPTFRGWRKDKK